MNKRMKMGAKALLTILGRGIRKGGPLDFSSEPEEEEIKPPSSLVVTPVPSTKLIKWENGIPVPVEKPLLNSQQIKDVAAAVLSLPYEGEGDPLGADPELFGMSKLEVSLIKMARAAADGDKWAINFLLDRAVGKPKQTSETVKMDMTYEDYLKMKAEQDKQGGSHPSDMRGDTDRPIDVECTQQAAE